MSRCANKHPGLPGISVCRTKRTLFFMLRQMETAGKQFVLGSPEVKDVDSCR